MTYFCSCCPKYVDMWGQEKKVIFSSHVDYFSSQLKNKEKKNNASYAQLIMTRMVLIFVIFFLFIFTIFNQSFSKYFLVTLFLF